jgi:hypothetical protein
VGGVGAAGGGVGAGVGDGAADGGVGCTGTVTGVPGAGTPYAP